MTLTERKATLEQDRARVFDLRKRAVEAANQAQMQLVKIEAQLALLEELTKEAE